MTEAARPPPVPEAVRLGAAVIAGLCLAAALPPWRVGALGLLSVAILGWIFSSGTIAQTIRAGWLAGTSAILAIGTWMIPLVPRFTGLPRVLGVVLWLLSGAFMGLWLGVAGGLAAWSAPVRGRALAAAAGLLVAERFGPSIFPMMLALPLVDTPWLAQSADLIGVQGLGAVLLGTSVAVSTTARVCWPRAGWTRAGWTRARGTRAGGPGVGPGADPGAAGSAVAAGAWVLAVLLLTAYGRSRTAVVEAARDRADVLRVGLVQPVIPATLRWQPEMAEPIRGTLWRLTGSLLGRSPAVVIWHEGAYPYRLPYRAGTDGASAAPVLPPVPAGRVGGWPTLVFGSAAEGADGAIYNAVFARSPDGTLGRPVAKRVLVPFGEYVPGVRWLPFLGRWFHRAEGLHPGGRPELLLAAGRTAGVLNCFEDTLPWSAAEVASADLLVNLTNDAWFAGAAPAQHMLNARWRAIECRRDLVRAVNSGYSGHIDALGRVVAVLPAGLPAAEMVFPRVALGLHPLAPGFILTAPWIALAAIVLSLATRRVARTWRTG